MSLWDEIRKQNRRTRVKKWAALLVGLPILFYVGSLYVKTWYPVVVQVDKKLREPPVAKDPTPIPSTSITDFTTESSETETSSTSSTPSQTTPSITATNATSESADVQQVSDSAEQEVSPSEINRQLERQADTALRNLQRRIARLQGDAQRLDELGGEEWAVSKAMSQAASREEDYAEVIRLSEQAINRLDQLAPEIDYAELQKQIHGRPLSDRLAAILQFSQDHSEHPRLPNLHAVLSEVTREQWMALAVDELDAASPDDSGFAEAWLPIASAWQVVGNDAEVRESIRRARESLSRMTAPERVIESTLDLCQHDNLDPSFAEPLIFQAVTMCEQVADKWTRGTFYAHLSGLSAKFGLQPLASRLLDQAIAPESMKGEFGVTAKLILTQRCRAAAWTERPETLVAYCRELEKLNYPDPRINANCYAHVAIAAARHADRPAFFNAMLRADNALAPLRVYDYPNDLYAERLAEANLSHRRGRAALIIANNIPDPNIRASLLFRVVTNAPQELRAPHTDELFRHIDDENLHGLLQHPGGLFSDNLRSGH